MHLNKYKTIAIIGEILFDVYSDRKFLGGAPLNFALNLNYLKKRDISIYSSIGNDDLGDEAKKYCSTFFSTKNIIQKNSPTDQVTVTVEGGENSFRIENNSLFDTIKFDCRNGIVYFGSLSMRYLTNLENLKKLNYQNNYFICDLNLRQPYYSRESIETLIGLCNILKVNREELDIVSNLFNIQDCENSIEFISKKFNIDIVIVTNGEKGGEVFSKDGRTEYSTQKIKTISTVGAGDSFFAGFMHGILEGYSITKASEIGSEISALVCQQDLPFLEKKNKFENNVVKKLF